MHSMNLSVSLEMRNSKMNEKPLLTDQTADMVKILLKETVKMAMNIEDKEARLKMLPHILEGIDLFDLKR